MVDFTSLSNVAQRLIQENGRSITLTNHSDVANNASKPWLGDNSSGGETLTVIAAFFDPAQGDREGSLVEEGAKRALIADNDVGAFPISTDRTRLVDGSTTYRIAQVRTVQPATKNVYYELILVT